MSILLSPALQWLPVLSFLLLYLRAQLNLISPLGLSPPRHWKMPLLQLFLAKHQAMFLPILSWFLLLPLIYSSTGSSVCFSSSLPAVSDHAFDLSSALVCLLFLLSNAQPGLPGHTWIQRSFCSDFGCVTVAQCHRSQA